MKTITGFFGAALLMPLAMAGTSRTYPVEAFDRIEVSARVELKVHVGAPQSVVAESGNGDFDDLEIKVNDGSLVVGRQHHWYSVGWFNHSRYTVDVTVPQLRGVRASSSATAEVSGPVSGDAQIGASSSGRVQVAEVNGGRVSLEASSSGRISIGELHAPMVDVHVSSSAVVEAGGACDTLRARATSSARIRASGLHCEDVAVDASSSGHMQVFARHGATANASSSGRIRIAGKPGRVEQHASSSGSIDVTD
jgi:hypothetical protein